jgi:hypothetical protein
LKTLSGREWITVAAAALEGLAKDEVSLLESIVSPHTKGGARVAKLTSTRGVAGAIPAAGDVETRRGVADIADVVALILAKGDLTSAMASGAETARRWPPGHDGTVIGGDLGGYAAWMTLAEP